MPHTSRLGRGLAAALLSGALLLCLPGVSLAAGDKVAAIARTFAKSSVDSGAAVGAGVGILTGRQPPRYFSFGLANAASGQPFGPDSAFEIGSVTKVFTTNLLGQEVFNGQLGLNDALSAFPVQLGSFKPLTSEVTLLQLADFTAGFPSYAPLCKDPPHVPGCLPSSRPDTSVYNAQDFLKYFQNAVPEDYQLPKPVPVTSLPAPYFYSDFDVGLLGLILGGNPNVKLSNQALDGWAGLLANRLLVPLGMRHTYFYPPPRSQASVALGYNQATGSAVIANGQVSGIKLKLPGSGYSAPPQVRILGGGGTGAEATASINSEGAVSEFLITKGGQGYVVPPAVTFTSTGAGPTSAATASVIVSNKKVTGIKIFNPGSGYTTAPDVIFSGGRRNGIGRDARGTAHIAHGQVTFVSIDDGGDGYVQPVAVIVKPGQPFASPIPIWAAAGSLHSTIRDMTVFAAAALGQARGGLPVNPAIMAGFKIAETPYACSSGKDPSLSMCPAGTPLSGLSWDILPEDTANNVPVIVLKNGGLNGFSTQLFLMPARGLAVVVFVNSNGDTSTGEKSGVAELIARNIFYALYYGLVLPD